MWRTPPCLGAATRGDAPDAGAARADPRRQRRAAGDGSSTAAVTGLLPFSPPWPMPLRRRNRASAVWWTRTGARSGSPRGWRWMRRGGVAGHDFFGPPLNRCARILAAAHGGQVLLSEEAHRLLSTTSSGGWQVRAMGEHRFKGLGKPQHVFLFPARGLSNDFRRFHRPDAGGHVGPGPRSGATSCGNGSGRVTSGSSTAYQPTVGREVAVDPPGVRQQAGVRPPFRGRGLHRRPAGAPTSCRSTTSARARRRSTCDPLAAGWVPARCAGAGPVAHRPALRLLGQIGARPRPPAG